jgi:hypothetical protein
MTNLLHFTINVRKSHRQPQYILQLVCEDRVLFVSVDLHVSLCRQQHPKCERAIRLCIHLSFVKFAPHPTKKKIYIYNGVRSVYSNSSISANIQNYTHVHMNFFLTMTDTITSQSIDLSSWITLYKLQYTITARNNPYLFMQKFLCSL